MRTNFALGMLFLLAWIGPPLAGLESGWQHIGEAEFALGPFSIALFELPLLVSFFGLYLDFCVYLLTCWLFGYEFERSLDDAKLKFIDHAYRARMLAGASQPAERHFKDSWDTTLIGRVTCTMVAFPFRLWVALSLCPSPLGFFLVVRAIARAGVYYRAGWQTEALGKYKEYVDATLAQERGISVNTPSTEPLHAESHGEQRSLATSATPQLFLVLFDSDALQPSLSELAKQKSLGLGRSEAGMPWLLSGPRPVGQPRVLGFRPSYLPVVGEQIHPFATLGFQDAANWMENITPVIKSAAHIEVVVLAPCIHFDVGSRLFISFGLASELKRISELWRICPDAVPESLCLIIVGVFSMREMRQRYTLPESGRIDYDLAGARTFHEYMETFYRTQSENELPDVHHRRFWVLEYPTRALSSCIRDMSEFSSLSVPASSDMKVLSPPDYHRLIMRRFGDCAEVVPHRLG